MGEGNREGVPLNDRGCNIAEGCNWPKVAPGVRPHEGIRPALFELLTAMSWAPSNPLELHGIPATTDPPFIMEPDAPPLATAPAFASVSATLCPLALLEEPTAASAAAVAKLDCTNSLVEPNGRIFNPDCASPPVELYGTPPWCPIRIPAVKSARGFTPRNCEFTRDS